MKVVARHKHAPLVCLDDGTVIDTEDLEVIGNGPVSGDSWEMSPEMEIDSRWEEIARADAANLGVTERKIASGPRTFRAPSHVRDTLAELGVASPLAEGKGLTLDELGALVEDDAVTGPPEEWMFGILNKHEENPDDEEERNLFSLAEPELDFDEIDSAMDDDSVTAAARQALYDQYADTEMGRTELVAAVEPPPGDFAKVVYLALIEEDDQKSVQDLVALVSTKVGAASAFTYGDKGWEESQEVLTKLQAPAPPPIKQLEEWQTESIVAQISSTGELSDEAKAEPWEEPADDTVHAQPENPDGPQETVQASAFSDLAEGGVLWGPDNKTIISVILAAGGADRNRGNAETLRRYWTVGKGGAKIRWGTPGDWTRCRRMLTKHLGPRAAGYCALRHKEMTGMWTGDRAHRALSASADQEDHPRALTAAWKPLSSEFLSVKAKAQPRDRLGRWIDMGAAVRWTMKQRSDGRNIYGRGRVTAYNPQSGRYTVEPTVLGNKRPTASGPKSFDLEGSDLEVIKAVIADDPSRAAELLDETRDVAPNDVLKWATATKQSPYVKPGDVMFLPAFNTKGKPGGHPRAALVLEHDAAGKATHVRELATGREEIVDWGDASNKNFAKYPERHFDAVQPTEKVGRDLNLTDQERAAKWSRKRFTGVRVGDVAMLPDGGKGVVTAHGSQTTKLRDLATGEESTVDWTKVGQYKFYSFPEEHATVDERFPNIAADTSKYTQLRRAYAKPGDIMRMVNSHEPAVILEHDPIRGVSRVRILETGREVSVDWGNVQNKEQYPRIDPDPQDDAEDSAFSAPL